MSAIYRLVLFSALILLLSFLPSVANQVVFEEPEIIRDSEKITGPRTFSFFVKQNALKTDTPNFKLVIESDSKRTARFQSIDTPIKSVRKGLLIDDLEKIWGKPFSVNQPFYRFAFRVKDGNRAEIFVVTDKEKRTTGHFAIRIDGVGRTYVDL